MLPEIRDYCNHSTDAKYVRLANVAFYFSYQTVVAFEWGAGCTARRTSGRTRPAST